MHKNLGTSAGTARTPGKNAKTKKNSLAALKGAAKPKNVKSLDIDRWVEEARARRKP